MKRNIFYSATIVALTLLVNLQVNAQVAINTTGAGPNASAMLDISSTTGGVLVPRMTTAQRTAIGSPATGLLVYQTDAPAGFYFYNGAAWMQLTGGGAETDPIVKAVNGIVKSNGTTISAAVASDFPILNQNTTGTASTLSSTLAINKGGTASTTGNNLLPTQTNKAGRYLTTDGTTPTWVTVALGGVTSVTANTPITVNNVDPAKPVISLSGIVPASNGGTGYNSFTTGDILYANSPTTLNILPAAAAGNALISQGVGVAPIWGKIDLATSTSGTFSRSVTTISSNYTILTTDNVIVCQGDADFTVTLPTAVGCKGKVYLVKSICSETVNITLSTTSNQLFDNAGSSLPISQYGFFEVISDGSNWIIIGQ